GDRRCVRHSTPCSNGRRCETSCETRRPKALIRRLTNQNEQANVSGRLSRLATLIIPVKPLISVDGKRPLLWIESRLICRVERQPVRRCRRRHLGSVTSVSQD